MENIKITTERLELKPIKLEDAEDLFKITSNKTTTWIVKKDKLSGKKQREVSFMLQFEKPIYKITDSVESNFYGRIGCIRYNQITNHHGAF